MDGGAKENLDDMIWYDMIWYDMIWYDMNPQSPLVSEIVDLKVADKHRELHAYWQ